MHRPHKVSTKILGLGIFMVGVVLLSVGLIIGLEFPVYVSEKIIRDQCILDKDHVFYDKWSKDERWTRLNRLYYWTLDNPDEFRQGGTPRFVERGPFVYSEERRYVNVEFSGTRISYQVKMKQTFDADLTRKECGNTCTETDNLTILNKELILNLYRDGGWDSYIFKQIPAEIQNIMDKLEKIFDDETDMYRFLGCVDESCDNQTLNLAQQSICDVKSISFGEFLQQNNDSRAQAVMKNLQDSVTTMASVYLLKSLYQQLMNTEFDSPSGSDICDTGSKLDFYWVVKVKDINPDPLPDYEKKDQTYFRVNLTSGCNLLSLTQLFTNHMLSSSEWPKSNWSFSICSENEEVCANIEADFETVLSYFIVINEFVQLYLLQNFVSLSKSLAENQIFYTKSQKYLALGHTEETHRRLDASSKLMKSILMSHSTFEDVVYTSPKLSLSTCLDEGNSDNNMIVREYNGSQFAPPSVYSGRSRRHFGYTTFLPPSDDCRACAKAQPNNNTYEIFNEDLYRSITFEGKHEVDFNGHRLFKFEISDSNFSPNHQCHLINTTSVLQYPSFIGPPYFEGLDCPYIRNLLIGNSVDHKSYIEVEPLTGRIWRQSTKLQTSIMITTEMKGKLTESTFDRIGLLDIPLPLYWVDRSAVISEDEMEYFSYKIVRLMTVSCGGLIGLTTAALITMGLSFFVGLLSTRKNRIAPVENARRTSSIIHGP